MKIAVKAHAPSDTSVASVIDRQSVYINALFSQSPSYNISFFDDSNQRMTIRKNDHKSLQKIHFTRRLKTQMSMDISSIYNVALIRYTILLFAILFMPDLYSQSDITIRLVNPSI